MFYITVKAFVNSALTQTSVTVATSTQYTVIQSAIIAQSN